MLLLLLLLLILFPFAVVVVVLVLVVVVGFFFSRAKMTEANPPLPKIRIGTKDSWTSRGHSVGISIFSWGLAADTADADADADAL